MGFHVPFVRRYVAGTVRNDAITAAHRLNTNGIAAAIDHLGENVKTTAEAAQSVEEYLKLLDEINIAGVDANISLKLTHLGLGLSEALAEENARRILQQAIEYGANVRIDMEGSAYTERIIQSTLRLIKNHSNVGVAVQCYLRRSASDIRMLNDAGVSVRLVKGAYKEPPSIAFPDKKDVDANFSKLMKELLLNGNHPAIATHDEKLINEAIRFAEENKIPKDGFDFEMLLGIKRSLQKELVKRGYRVRVYVPYGKDWMAYTLRRFRERKENVYFVVRNIFD